MIKTPRCSSVLILMRNVRFFLMNKGYAMDTDVRITQMVMKRPIAAPRIMGTISGPEMV